MLSPALPGLFFAFAGMTLLLFASVSSPVWEQVYFLKAVAAGQETRWGVFGSCVVGAACSPGTLGYNFSLPNVSGNINTTLLHNLSICLILIPIAGALALFSLIFGLLASVLASRAMTVLMALAAALGAFVSLVVFVIEIVLFTVVRDRIRSAGYPAELGNANWLVVGAVVALFIGFCTSLCGAFGRYSSGRFAGEKY